MDRLCRILIFVQSGQFNVIPSTGILDQCTQNILALLPLARDTERSKYYSAKGGSETKQLKALLLSWGSPGVSWLGWMESLAVVVAVAVVVVVVIVVVVVVVASVVIVAAAVVVSAAAVVVVAAVVVAVVVVVAAVVVFVVVVAVLGCCCYGCC